MAEEWKAVGEEEGSVGGEERNQDGSLTMLLSADQQV